MNKIGLQLLNAGKHEEAIDFFTKAISQDPSYPDPYYNRGEIYLMLGNVVEGNTDLHKARELRAGRLGRKQTRRPVKKFDWQGVESVYDDVFSNETTEQDDDALSFDSEIYDYIFSDDSLETDELWEGLLEEYSEDSGCPAVLEFLNGRREEISRLVLFHPTDDVVSVISLDKGTRDRVVPLKEICCIRLAALPRSLDPGDKSACQVEIIQTVDGNIYHELINPGTSVIDQGIIAMSTKAETFLPYTFFPKNSIKSRSLQRQIGEILLEKRFISQDALKSALEEHEMLKNMPLGKIIARLDNILCSSIEEAMEQAEAEGKKDLKVGEILLDAGLVDEERILEALAVQKKLQCRRLGEFLVSKGILREQELFISLAEKFRMPFIDLRKQKVSKKVLNLLPRDIVLKYSVMPIGWKENTLIVASSHPDVSHIRREIAKRLDTGDIRFVLAQPTHLKNVINILYRDRRPGAGKA